MSDIVAVRISKETKKIMTQIKHVDWPEVIRKAIEKKIREEKRRKARLIEDNLRKSSSGTRRMSLSEIVIQEREAG
jgi:regulator of protease activity HflC (stomatin/prohibitin superfamily)